MLEQIHKHRRRIERKAAGDGKGSYDDDDDDGDDDDTVSVPVKAESGAEVYRYKSRPSVVETDTDSHDVMDSMLECLAEYHVAHRNGIRELLTAAIAELKKSGWCAAIRSGQSILVVNKSYSRYNLKTYPHPWHSKYE